jgi:hypothetical protein
MYLQGGVPVPETNRRKERAAEQRVMKGLDPGDRMATLPPSVTQSTETQPDGTVVTLRTTIGLTQLPAWQPDHPIGANVGALLAACLPPSHHELMGYLAALIEAASHPALAQLPELLGDYLVIQHLDRERQCASDARQQVRTLVHLVDRIRECGARLA